MIWLGGLLLTIIGFILGRVFSQSESILSDKRRLYEEFLRECPAPCDAYESLDSEAFAEHWTRFQQVQGPLLLYASTNVALALSQYINAFARAQEVLIHERGALHPVFKGVAKAHNDLILEMRRDVLAFSAFAYTGKTRLPPDALEQAKRSSR